MPPNNDYPPNLTSPSLPHRALSHGTILGVSALFRIFTTYLNKTEVHGLPQFLSLLESRQDVSRRTRGLITVSNHVSVLDEPSIWGVIPLHFSLLHLPPSNHRWSLGGHDILFKNMLLAKFFTAGQTLPAHRAAYSTDGGPFQNTMTEAVRLLGRIHEHKPFYNPHVHTVPTQSIWTNLFHRLSQPVDPFSPIDPPPSYHSVSHPSNFANDRQYLAPSRYACNSYSWIHIFPEGMIHQNPSPSNYSMRYFKWGIARLILEPPECPDVVPMFITGFDGAMHETRTFPRFIPRPFNDMSVTFGAPVNMEQRFGDLRRRWKALVKKDAEERGEIMTVDTTQQNFGLVPESLKDHPEAMELRIECAYRVREEVLKLRRQRGYPDEDPKSSAAETWLREGAKREGKMKDGTWIKEE